MEIALGIVMFVILVAVLANAPVGVDGGATSPPPPPVDPATGTPSGSTGQSSGGVTPGSSSGAGSSGATPAPGVVQPAQSLGTPPAQQAGQVPGAAPTPPADWQQQLAQLDHYRQQLQQYEQYKHLIPLGYQAYQQRLTPQQQQQQVADQAKKNIFGLEPFDFGLLQFVGKDPQTGQMVLMPGAPPDALHRVQAYQQQLQEVQKNFWANPETFLRPLIVEEAKKIAAEQFQQQYGSIQQQQQAQSILQQNSNWLYERDAQGNPVTRFDPATGQSKPMLSAWGQFYARAVQQAQTSGVTDPRAQHDFAMALVENAAYRVRAQQAAAPQQQQQQQQQFLQQQQQPLSATIPTPSTLPPPPPAEQSLRDRMRAAFDQAGITDPILQQQLANPTGRAA